MCRAPMLRTFYCSESSMVSRAFSVLCTRMRVFDVRVSSSSPKFISAKFRLCRDLHCWASPWRKIAYSLTHSPSRELKQLNFEMLLEAIIPYSHFGLQRSPRQTQHQTHTETAGFVSAHVRKSTNLYCFKRLQTPQKTQTAYNQLCGSPYIITITKGNDITCK